MPAVEKNKGDDLVAVMRRSFEVRTNKREVQTCNCEVLGEDLSEEVSGTLNSKRKFISVPTVNAIKGHLIVCKRGPF